MLQGLERNGIVEVDGNHIMDHLVHQGIGETIVFNRS